MYVILYDRDNLTASDFQQLANIKCKRIICLTDDENKKSDYCYRIKPNRNRINGLTFLDKDRFGIRTFEKQWDFVKWLNNR